jgi:predicted DCC family thiol-disulfide oxidoreductase YuxK
MAGLPRTLFYDATCGLCAGAVAFLRRIDRHVTLAFEPLGGERFLALVPAGVREQLPDSLVLVAGGRVLVRSAALLEAFEGIGGAWSVVARVGRLLPESLRDRTYAWVARNRKAGAGCLRR